MQIMVNSNVSNFRNSNCYKIKCNVLKTFAVVASFLELRQVSQFLHDRNLEIELCSSEINIQKLSLWVQFRVEHWITNL